MRKSILFILFMALMLVSVGSAYACESCLLSRTGRDESQTIAKSESGKFLLKYWYERQDWESMDPAAAHELHHDGHHIHVKTTESIHHFGAGYNWNDRLLTTLDLPFVSRSALEIHSHANVGKEYTAQGFGDATVTTIYEAWTKGEQSLGLVAGVKLPTGATREINPLGSRFEPELQPGTGSWDYHLGGVYRASSKYLDLTTNMLYVIKNEGAQAYQFGNVFSLAAFLDYVPPQDTIFKDARPGLVFNWKEEARHEDNGIKESDSGGSTVFLGPEFSYNPNERSKLFVNFQWPVYQDLGGVHQEVEKIWNAGAQLTF
jgi:hypothetical protein